jgi:hypothetical protein
VKFGNHVSDEEANEIIAALQSNLPQGAQQLRLAPGSDKHFITLGLS